MIQVGYVFQHNLVLQCMDGYSFLLIVVFLHELSAGAV